MTKILFFTTALEHTTFRKTAQMLHNEGLQVHLIGFTRNNFPTGNFGELSVESLGVISHGSYMSRIFKLFKFLFLFRKRAKDYDVIYNFTLDTLIISKIALVFKKKNWVYQIQDIRSIFFGSSIKSRLARIIEGLCLKKIDLLVVSSINYFQDYFKLRYNFKAEKVFVIENKLVRGTIHPTFSFSPQSSKITIGYFGVMRCSKSWELLKSVLSEFSNKFFLKMRGKPVVMPDLENEILHYHNIDYGGEYRSPNDLDFLYNNVDIVWACYPFHDSTVFGNWKMARTIRFYESCAFGKPVIVQKGTPQAAEVDLYGLGLVIDLGDFSEAIKLINSIDQNKLDIWKENIKKLDPSFYFYGNEYFDLANKITKLK